MATSPDDVRRGLLTLTGAAKADVRAVAQAATQDPEEARAALFAAAPLVVAEYNLGAAVLAADWYEELRFEAGASSPFRPGPFIAITDDEVAAVVAQATMPLYEIQRGIERELDEAFAESVRQVEEEAERLIAEAFRDTVTGNAANDPEAAGWRRHARPGACKFCLMLAARGAVYTESTARFAAHGAVMSGGRKGGNCMCIAGPAFGEPDFTATPMQYLASSKTRTPEQQARLREYLNDNFPDAPG